MTFLTQTSHFGADAVGDILRVGRSGHRTFHQVLYYPGGIEADLVFRGVCHLERASNETPDDFRERAHRILLVLQAGHDAIASSAPYKAGAI